MTGARTEVPSLAGLAQPDLILLNDDDLGYAIIRFDERSLATLTEHIGRFRDGLARTLCWSAVVDMAGQAELSVPAFVRIVAAGMGSEPSVAVLQLLHAETLRLLATTADPDWVPQRQGAAGGRGDRAAAGGRARQRPPARVGAAPRRDRSRGRSSSTWSPGCWTAARRSRAWPSTPSCAGRSCAGWPRPGGLAMRRSTPSSSGTAPTRAGATPLRPGPGSPTPSTRRRRGGCWRSPPSSGLEESIGSHAGLQRARARGAARAVRGASTSSSCRRSGRRATDLLRVFLGRLLFPYPAASPELPGPGRCVPGRAGPGSVAQPGGHRGPRHRREGAAVARAARLGPI